MSEIDRDKAHLFPPFVGILDAFEFELRRRGLPFCLFEGLRTWERQAELYAQGRTAPGPVVTWAQPGSSFHFYGLAADYVLDGTPDRPGVQWSWELKADLDADGRSDWEQMAEVAAETGLETGWGFPGRKVDPPHVQYPCGLTIAHAREIYLDGGLDAVWNAANEWLERRGEGPA